VGDSSRGVKKLSLLPARLEKGRNSMSFVGSTCLGNGEHPASGFWKLLGERGLAKIMLVNANLL
jgi:hypothetical protein